MDIKNQINTILKEKYQVSLAGATDEQVYYSLLNYTKLLLDEKSLISGDKRVFYFSAEFLIGKLLSNNLINLGIYDKVARILKEEGKELALIEEIEVEPSLGNGGLGRLAACFLDSIATLDLPGDGIGLNYHLGLFKQKFINNKQMELPDPWIETDSWLNKTANTYTVEYGDFSLQSVMYDLDVVGYHGNKNKLHLFDVAGVDESLVNRGIDFDKTAIAKNLTLFLYPDDSTKEGQLLRIYQQYFMVSSGAQYILNWCRQSGFDLADLADHVVIQINDTHPSLIIPELIRLLTKEGFTLHQAVKIVEKTCAYTNHTILKEALEKWPRDYLKQVVPQLMDIIESLDAIIKERSTNQNVQIIDSQNLVHMAHMDIHFGFSVNGVAKLHTDILKEVELNDFYNMYPEKFNNKTNGITFRRWLISCNHELARYLESLIGTGFKNDGSQLEKLLDFRNDKEVLANLLKIKSSSKAALARHLKETLGCDVDCDSIFDIQIKRMHEYKRQQLNVLYIIDQYLKIKAGYRPKTPLTCIFGAKAAPSYVLAKDIIHLILSLSELIDNDEDVAPYLKVVMVENYDVTLAQRLFPAADISEQISLASKEASGTGNMKFMLNGAVTLGTDDGANVEIHDLVGDDNVYIFGASSSEVIEHYRLDDYSPQDILESKPHLRKLVDFIIGDQLSVIGDKESLTRVYQELVGRDYFMTLLDLENYIEMKEKMLDDYQQREKWSVKMLVNIAMAGFFSSDRTIGQYNEEIWKLK